MPICLTARLVKWAFRGSLMSIIGVAVKIFC
jgi:hypothetical protein